MTRLNKCLHFDALHSTPSVFEFFYEPIPTILIENLTVINNRIKVHNETKIDAVFNSDVLLKIDNLNMINVKKNTIYVHILEFDMLCGNEV